MNVLNMPGKAEENSTAVATTPVRDVLRRSSSVPDARARARPRPEAERQQVDRRLDDRGERRRLPVAPEDRHVAAHHARERRRFEAPDAPVARRLPAGSRRAALRAHSISSPVSATNASSRFAGRRTPSGASPSSVSARMIATAGPLRRLDQPCSRRQLAHLRQALRRAVDLEHLARPRASRTSSARRALRDDPPRRHHRHGVRQALRLLDVVRAHQHRHAAPRAARRSASTAPGGPADRGPRSARPAAPGAAGGSARAPTSRRRRIPPESSLHDRVRPRHEVRDLAAPARPPRRARRAALDRGARTPSGSAGR